MMDNRKKVAALICGMFGCVFLGGGDWLMMYGNTAYRGQIYWLTEGVAQIPSWRNSLVLCQEKVQVKRGLFVRSMESYSTVFCNHVFQILQFG